MKKYDFVVIGSGCGANIADEAVGHGKKVAVIDRGPLGGTCLNVGCVPSKMLIYPADRIVEIQNSRKLGIEAQITQIDFASIMGRMRRLISEDQGGMHQSLKQIRNLDYFEAEGHFVRD